MDRVDKLNTLKSISEEMGLPDVVALLNEELRKVRISDYNINKFKEGWNCIHDLIYKDIKDKAIWMWVEGEYFIHKGSYGEPREVIVRHIKGEYIRCDVDFVLKTSRDLSQNVVAWSKEKLTYSPYLSEEQRIIWSQIVSLTDIRNIKYK